MQRAEIETHDQVKILTMNVNSIHGHFRSQMAKLAIEEAFGLAELVWIDTQSHQSFHTFKPVVERSNIAVVLLAIRWASHSYGEVIRFCKNNSTPLVRLPTGYNANQIAAQILAQCSDQLSAVNTIEESTQ